MYLEIKIVSLMQYVCVEFFNSQNFIYFNINIRHEFINKNQYKYFKIAALLIASLMINNFLYI